MKNRDAVSRKLETIETKLSKLKFGLNRGDRDACFEVIEEIKESIEQVKGYIESEPISGHELNKI